MVSNSISEFNARLLELEKRLDAFRSLQEDELSDIKSILVQIRQDLLVIDQSNTSIPSSKILNETGRSSEDGNESLDDLPILAL